MSTDLHRALSEIADQAADAAGGLSVDAVLFQRRRRRTVHRSIGAGGIAAGIAGIAVVAGVLGGPTDPPTMPATPTPVPTSTPTAQPSPTTPPVAAPACGDSADGLPVGLTLTAEPEYPLGDPITGTVEAAAGVLDGRTVSLALLSQGVLVAGTEPTADAMISSIPEPCGGELVAGEYQLVAVADGPDGAVVSAPVTVLLSEPASADPSTVAAPLPDPYHLWGGPEDPYTSGDPGTTQPLPDGRYYARLQNLDPATRSFDATLYIGRWAEDARAWAETHAPELGEVVDGRFELTIGVVSAFEPTAFGTQRFTLPEDGRVYDWCASSGQGIDIRDSSLEGLLTGMADCTDTSGWSALSGTVQYPYSGPVPSELERGFWLDVRGGEVRQLIAIFTS